MLQTKAGRCLQQLGYFKVSKSASVGGSPQPLLELRFTIPSRLPSSLTLTLRWGFILKSVRVDAEGWIKIFLFSPHLSVGVSHRTLSRYPSPQSGFAYLLFSPHLSVGVSHRTLSRYPSPQSGFISCSPQSWCRCKSPHTKLPSL